MAFTEIYIKTWCPWSRLALGLINSKGVEFKVIDLTYDTGSLEQEMRTRSGRRSVPQIFIDGRHVGGFDDLAALDQSGELDKLLHRSESSSAA